MSGTVSDVGEVVGGQECVHRLSFKGRERFVVIQRLRDQLRTAVMSVKPWVCGRCHRSCPRGRERLKICRRF